MSSSNSRETEQRHRQTTRMTTAGSRAARTATTRRRRMHRFVGRGRSQPCLITCCLITNPLTLLVGRIYSPSRTLHATSSCTAPSHCSASALSDTFNTIPGHVGPSELTHTDALPGRTTGAPLTTHPLTTHQPSHRRRRTCPRGSTWKASAAASEAPPRRRNVLVRSHHSRRRPLHPYD